MARVVILGAGIAGHTAARHLNKMIGARHEVVVISPNAKWNWIPSNIWVGVGQMKEEEVTKSGIVLPDTVDKEKKMEGEIIALGNGKKLSRLDLKAGMKVLFKKWGGEEVDVDGVEHKILNHDDVIAVIE